MTLKQHGEFCMQAIEFEAQLNDGMIPVPAPYKYWHAGQKVKVIVLGDDEINDAAAEKDKPVLSCLDLIRDDVGIIEDAPSDLSTNPIHLQGYGE